MFIKNFELSKGKTGIDCLYCITSSLIHLLPFLFTIIALHKSETES